MEFFGIVIFAVSLSMDALGIGVSYGLRRVRVPWRAKLIICAVSMIFTEVAALAGTLLLSLFPEKLAKFIGCAMLAVLGIFFLLQAILPKTPKKNSPEKTLFSLALKPFGITVQIIRDPIVCDLDNSSHIDAKEALYLGTALSIDSFGAGVSSAATGLNSLHLPLAAGVCQLVFLCAGDYLGKKITRLKNIDSKVFVAISGVLLILLAGVRFWV